MHDEREGSHDLDELLERAGTGDEDSFASFYDHLASRVFGMALRVLNDPAQAEEVTQEVFVEVWRGAANFDPARGSAQSWIITIAHRRSVDRVRSTQAARRRDMSWHVKPSASSSASYPDFSQAVVEVLAIQTALARLTPVQRNAIELAYFDGYTYSDVAQLMSAPLGTTKTRIRDALAQLRVLLNTSRVEIA